METDSAFGRSPRGVVLHAVASETAHVSVIHANRQADHQHAFRGPDHRPDIFIQSQDVGRGLKVLHCQIIRAAFLPR